jgi:dynein regulatory complex protein 1
MPGCFQGQVVSRRAADREREYWERLKRVVGDKVVRVWGKLEKQLGSYYKLLVQWGEGLSAISKLQQENEELRNLLNQYLASKINGELQIPPMAVL